MSQVVQLPKKSIYKSIIPSDFSLGDEPQIHLDYERIERPLRKNKSYIKKITKRFQIYQTKGLNFDIIENLILLKKQNSRAHHSTYRQFMQWVVFFAIGCITAVIAAAVDICVVYIVDLKFKTIIFVFEEYSNQQLTQLLVWLFFNMGPMFIGSFIVTYWEPCAAGSGIPVVKAHLNGTSIQHALTFKTLVIKTAGLICTMVAGVICGKEGPMIHVGAIVGAIISEGRMKIFQKEVKLCKLFREDYHQRDFISAGAACGISAAFGSSVGGVLFSLEESSSFWRQNLTWRIFFSSVITYFVCTEILAYSSRKSIVTIGTTNIKYSLLEIPAFICIGILGGLIGALWNFIQSRLRLNQHKWLQVLEACATAGITAIFGYIMVFYKKDCTNLDRESGVVKTKMFCDNQHNNVATLWMSTPQVVMADLMNRPANSYTLTTLAIHVILFFGLSVITFGTSSSNGSFVPSLLLGAAYGRLIIVCVKLIFPSLKDLDEGKYALIGGAANLAGVVRMTISLTVILMESNNSTSFVLPIVFTLLAAKWTGDFFNEGLYNSLIEFNSIPILPWDPPPLAHSTYADEIMTPNPDCVRVVENVNYVMEILRSTNHNGFPVVHDTHQVDSTLPVTVKRFGKLRGLILREQIVAMLMKKMFVETIDTWDNETTYNDCEDLYLRKPNLKDVNLTYEEKTYRLDFRPIMNNSPYSSLVTSTLPRMFRLVRTLGLLHLPIVNNNNEVVGIVTRDDLAIYKTITQGCKLKLRVENYNRKGITF